MTNLQSESCGIFDQLQCTPLWLNVQDRSGRTLLAHPHYLAPGVFGEPTPVQSPCATHEVFNQHHITVVFDVEPLNPLAAITISTISPLGVSGTLNLHIDSGAGPMLLMFPDGGVYPRLSVQGIRDGKALAWHLPAGSLVFQCLLNGDILGRALAPIPSERMTSRNWKRCHHIYANPGTPFQATALVYRDSTDGICFVQEFNPCKGEAIVVDRFTLLW